MYIVRETNEDGTKKEYPCDSYEAARALLDEKTEADKAKNREWSEIKHDDERYSRVTIELAKWYILSILEVGAA